ncbi:TIGR00282 family metallophosphoesterase [bacterium]|nr:TIGR00282 family metallophosphoesterase [bacterium]
MSTSPVPSPSRTGGFIRVLAIGDVYGKPGLQAVTGLLPGLLRELNTDFCIVNGENVDHGKGITAASLGKLIDAGADVVTGGNHSLYRDRAHHIFDENPRILRPYNFPEGSPGRGAGIFDGGAGRKIAVVNLMGRALMPLGDDPFRVGQALVEELAGETSFIIIDFHAEATAEKLAFARYLDGMVTAIFGTHTHVQTADAQILPKGTGYITDLGMTGSHAGVIGMKTESALRRFLYPVGGGKADCAEGDAQLHGVLIEADSSTGRALGMKTVKRSLE